MHCERERRRHRQKNKKANNGGQNDSHHESRTGRIRPGPNRDQIARTMTVGELIEFLNNFDEDEKIYLSHDNGYTYGGITAYRFEEIDEDAEKE